MTEDERDAGVNWDLLGLYMSDHVSGSTAGINRIAYMAKNYADTPHGPALKRIERELRDERALVHSLLAKHGQPRRRHRQILAWVGERVGRLKLNGRIVGTSPMTPVLESELMRAAVLGKIGGWQTLDAYREQFDVPPSTFADLITQAERQIEDLSDMHEWARERAFVEGASLPLQ